MKQDHAGRDVLPPPFPMTKPEDWQPLPPRPWIVWAFLGISVLGVAYGVAFDAVARENFSLFGTLWSLGFEAFSVLVIWNASRIGWSIFTALSVLFLPFLTSFLDAGMWGRGVVAIQLISLCILVSPWMFRWIWRDGRPMTGRADEKVLL